MISKAVIPAAGLGTRFLPATKATPKEMLPVVDKPAIQYVVEEAVAAGLRDVLMVTGRNKRALEDHFDKNAELEDLLEKSGRHDLLAAIRHSSNLANMHYVRQGDPRGLGDAVLTAADHVGDEAFAVLLGDDLIDSRDPILPQMIEVHERFGGSVIALMEVPNSEISRYGAAAISQTDDADVVCVIDLVEKPSAQEAPSNFAVLGRYLLAPEIFEALRNTKPGRGGEVQLTDAIQVLAKRADNGGPVHGVIFRGRRYDTGEKLSYLQSVVRMACEQSDLGPEFTEWLKKYISGNAVSK
ncbi:MAG: UTP--glucose-1-phosphate uridylyltransferase GalU [Actinomycetes bacterium]